MRRRQRRERGGSLPVRVQERLARYYGLDAGPSVADFVRPAGAGREALLIREGDDALELALCLPDAAIAGGAAPTLDLLCQVVEGVSHFVYVAERARRQLPATQLELELQAEIDKYVMLVADAGWSPARSHAVRARLFEAVTFAHPPGTERGDRYRMANDLAARFARRLESAFAQRGRFDEMRAALRRFYCAGQTEKLAIAQAA